jgi:hypothetical protein
MPFARAICSLDNFFLSSFLFSAIQGIQGAKIRLLNGKIVKKDVFLF